MWHCPYGFIHSFAECILSLDDYLNATTCEVYKPWRNIITILELTTNYKQLNKINQHEKVQILVESHGTSAPRGMFP